MSEKTSHSSYKLILKILVTMGLLTYVFKQIPWNDTVYLISSDLKSLGTVLKYEDGIVTLDREGTSLEVYTGQPVQIEESTNDFHWWLFPSQDLDFQKGQEIFAFPLDELNGKLKEGKRPESTAKTIVLSTQNGEEVIPVEKIGGGIDFGVKPGFPTLLRSLDLQIFIIASLLVTLSQVLSAIRWSILLRARNFVISWWVCIKLCYMGYFFSQVMPGTNGGDVVRAIYVARSNQDRGTAALSVFVDRLVGLFGIAIIGTISVLIQLGDPRIARYGYMMAIIVGILFFGACIYFSRSLRRVFRVEQILNSLPLGKKIHELEAKLFVYREHKKEIFTAFILTGIIQVNFIFVNYLLAKSLGMSGNHLGAFFVFLPIVTVLVSFPISFGGFGFREFLFVKFFAIFGLSGGLGFATSLLQGIVVLIWSLMGGFAFLSLKKDMARLDSHEKSLA